jgi:hypothetical protein
MTLTSKTVRHSSTVDWGNRTGTDTAALCTSTSSASTISQLAAIESVSVKSTGKVVASRRVATASSRSEGRPANSRMCVGASASAMAEPIPPPAPVMSAVGIVPA